MRKRERLLNYRSRLRQEKRHVQQVFRLKRQKLRDVKPRVAGSKHASLTITDDAWERKIKLVSDQKLSHVSTPLGAGVAPFL